MNIWAWIEAFAARTVEARDIERLRLVNVCWQSLPLIQTDPKAALYGFQEGIDLAERLDEPRWRLFFRHWRAQTLLFHQGDYGVALDQTAPAAAEARREAYPDFPQAVCLQDDLANAYLGIDPHGYSEETASLLAYMDAGTPEQCECRFCLRALRVEWPFSLGRWEEAQREALAYLQSARGHEFHFVFALLFLCRIAHRQGDWAALAHWAGRDAEGHPAHAEPSAHAERLMWRASATLRYHGPATALPQYRTARSYTRRLSGTLRPSHFDAWCDYYTQQGDFRRALRVRDRQWTEIAGKGQTHVECRCRLERCRLLIRLGQPTDAEVAGVREAARRLRDSSPVLAELDAILAPAVD